VGRWSEQYRGRHGAADGSGGVHVQALTDTTDASGNGWGGHAIASRYLLDYLAGLGRRCGRRMTSASTRTRASHERGSAWSTRSGDSASIPRQPNSASVNAGAGRR